MYVKDFKTAKVMRPFFNKLIPVELVAAIRTSLTKRPREYIFVQANDQPYKSVNAYTRYSNAALKRIFNNEYVSVNSLRHAFATWFHAKPNLTVRDRELVATQMGQRMKQTMLYVHLDQNT